jgi:hypothetical protein
MRAEPKVMAKSLHKRRQRFIPIIAVWVIGLGAAVAGCGTSAGKTAPPTTTSQAPPTTNAVTPTTTTSTTTNRTPPPGRNATVPAVKGLSEAQADQALQQFGLRLGMIIREASAGTPRGYIVSTDPPQEAGTKIPRGSAVNLLESLGPPGCGTCIPPVEATVPVVAGQTLAQAAMTLGQFALDVGTVTTERSSGVPGGEVIASVPSAGTHVTRFSAINLVVSTGPLLLRPSAPRSVTSLVTGSGGATSTSG